MKIEIIRNSTEWGVDIRLRASHISLKFSQQSEPIINMIKTAKFHFTYSDLVAIAANPLLGLLIPAAGAGKINLPLSITSYYKAGTGGTPFSSTSAPVIQYGSNPFSGSVVLRTLTGAFTSGGIDVLQLGASFPNIQGLAINRTMNNVGIYFVFLTPTVPLTGGNANSTLDIEIQYMTYDSNL
jgi:hypothetical protein